jgi:hypothetical protein
MHSTETVAMKMTGQTARGSECIAAQKKRASQGSVCPTNRDKVDEVLWKPVWLTNRRCRARLWMHCCTATRWSGSCAGHTRCIAVYCCTETRWSEICRTDKQIDVFYRGLWKRYCVETHWSGIYGQTRCCCVSRGRGRDREDRALDVLLHS